MNHQDTKAPSGTETGIMVNGKDFRTSRARLSHEEIVRLALGEVREGALVTYFWRQAGTDLIRQGILDEGKDVEIAEGMRFDVSETGSA